MAKAPEFVEEAGFIFVNEQKGEQKQKIILEIINNNSSNISVGLGDVDAFRNECSFINDSTLWFIQDSWTQKRTYINIFIQQAVKNCLTLKAKILRNLLS